MQAAGLEGAGVEGSCLHACSSGEAAWANAGDGLQSEDNSGLSDDELAALPMLQLHQVSELPALHVSMRKLQRLVGQQIQVCVLDTCVKLGKYIYVIVCKAFGFEIGSLWL